MEISLTLTGVIYRRVRTEILPFDAYFLKNTSDNGFVDFFSDILKKISGISIARRFCSSIFQCDVVCDVASFLLATHTRKKQTSRTRAKILILGLQLSEMIIYLEI